MKHWIYLTALALSLAGLHTRCSSLSEAIPVTQETRWSLAADKESEQSVVIMKGDSKAEILSKLGTPKKIYPVKNNPKAMVFHYARTVVGPMRHRQLRTKTGTMTIRDNINYIDSVDVYFENELVIAVEIDRNVEVPLARP